MCDNVFGQSDEALLPSMIATHGDASGLATNFKRMQVSEQSEKSARLLKERKEGKCFFVGGATKYSSDCETILTTNPLSCNEVGFYQ